MKSLFFGFLLLLLKSAGSQPTNCDYYSNEVNILGNCEVLTECDLNTPEFVEVDENDFATCVSECTSRLFQLVTLETHYKCIDSCDSFIIISNNNAECVTECASEPFTWYQDGDNKVCEDDCSGTGRPYFYADGDNKRCIDACSMGEYTRHDSTSGLTECLSECASEPFNWYQDGDNKVCEDDCSGTGRAFYYKDGFNKRCIDACSMGEYIKLDSLSGLKQCLTECSIGSFTWYQDGDSKICENDCSGTGRAFYYEDGINKKCVTGCNQGEFIKLDSLSGLKQCLTQCSIGSFTWYQDGDSKICEDDCSGTGRAFYYEDGINKRCVNSCAGTEYSRVDSVTALRQCLTECDSNQFYFLTVGTDKQCTIECDSNHRFFSQTGQARECKTACQPTEYIGIPDTNADGIAECLSVCGPDTFFYTTQGTTKNCAARCTDASRNYYKNTGGNANECLTSCLAGEYVKPGLNGNFECVSTCDTGPSYYFENSSDLNECTSEAICKSNYKYFIERSANFECVAACPSDMPFKKEIATDFYQCFSICPEKEKGGLCVTDSCAGQVYSTFTDGAGQSHLSCIDSCPTTAPYLPTTYNNEVESFTCTATCGTLYVKQETLGMRCLASAACPDDTYKVRSVDIERILGSTPTYTVCYTACPSKAYILGKYCAPKCESHEKTLSVAAAEKYSSAFCQMACYAGLYEEAYSITGYSTVMCVEKCASGFINISNRRECTSCSTGYAILQSPHSICTNRTDCKVNIGDGENYRVVPKEQNSLGFNECVLGCDLTTQKEYVTSNGDRKCISCTNKLNYLGNCVSRCQDNEVDEGKYCINCRKRSAYFYKGECISNPDFTFVLVNSEFNAINKCDEFDPLFAEYNGSCQRCPTGYAISATKCVNLIEKNMFDQNGFAKTSCSQDETPVNRICTKTEELLKPKTFKYDHLIQKMGCASNQVREGTKCVDCYLTSYFVLDFDKVCRSKCTPPYIPDNLNQKCVTCDSLTKNSLFEDGSCVSDCSAGLVSQEGVCVKCANNQVILADKCVDSCPEGYSTDDNNQCVAVGDCSVTPCLNEGTCTDNVCKCTSGFTGDKCELTAVQAATMVEVKRKILKSQRNKQ